jgi:hypothetical protein
MSARGFSAIYHYPFQRYAAEPLPKWVHLNPSKYSDRQTPHGVAAYLPTGPQPISPARPESRSVIDVRLN